MVEAETVAEVTEQEQEKLIGESHSEKFEKIESGVSLESDIAEVEPTDAETVEEKAVEKKSVGKTATGRKRK